MKKLLLALAFLAIPAVAQQKFSLFDRAVMRSGASACAKGGLMVSNDSSGSPTCLAIDSHAGYVLTGNGTGALPSWQASAGVGGSGTAGELAYWSGTSTLGSSPDLLLPNGSSRIAIGTSKLSRVANFQMPVIDETGQNTYGLLFQGTIKGTNNYYHNLSSQVLLDSTASLDHAIGLSVPQFYVWGGTPHVGTAYGLRIIDPGIGDDRWTIYAAGSGKSYLSGHLLIGTVTDSSPLTVNGDVTILAGSGGVYKFSDGSTQSSAAATGVLTTKGDVLGFDTAVKRVPVGTDTYVLTADSTQALGVKWAAAPGSSSGYAGSVWMMADPNFSTGASYERPAYPGPGAFGLVQLAPQRTWTETIADAKTNVPGGWSLANSGNLSAADENTTTAGGLYLAGSTGTTYDFSGSTQTGPYFYRSIDLGASSRVYYARVAVPSDVTSTSTGVGFFVGQPGTLNNNGRMWLSGGSSSSCIIGYGVKTTVASTTTACTNTNAGVWFKIERYGSQLLNSYSVTNSATIPTTGWTYPQALTTVFSDAASPEEIGFYLWRTGAVSPVKASLLFLDDTTNYSPLRFEASAFPFGTGFDNSSPVLTLISGFDLGSSSATLTDASVRSALTEITNPRSIDAAAWTYSVTRGSSAPVACGSYAAAGSVSVGGSGRYVSLCAKAASSGRAQAGSIDVSRLRIWFTP